MCPGGGGSGRPFVDARLDLTDLLREARQEASERMTERAEARGANAVVCVRYVSSTVAAGVSEILAYGTAVEIDHSSVLKLENEEELNASKKPNASIS